MSDLTPGATMYECPIIQCNWAHLEQPTGVDDRALATVFGAGVLAATTAFQRHHEIERTLRDHLETHTLQQWVDTCQQLRAVPARLHPEEQLALALAVYQLERGEPVTPNVAAACVAALERVTDVEADGA